MSRTEEKVSQEDQNAAPTTKSPTLETSTNISSNSSTDGCVDVFIPTSSSDFWSKPVPTEKTPSNGNRYTQGGCCI